MADPLLELRPAGLYCPAGGFYIDPWQPVDRAVVTHGHSDHAHFGCRHYLATQSGKPIYHLRLGREAEFDFVDYGEPRHVGGVKITMHPAGHMLGSAQVRLEHRGQIAVVTGDYKLEVDATCAGWEPVKCHLMVTESTFGLPIYHWRPQQEIYDSINDWWRSSAAAGKCCLLYGYAVGKSQRLLSGLDPGIGTIYTHGAVENGIRAYREAGVVLPRTQLVSEMPKGHKWAGALVLAVPGAHGTPWMRKFGAVSTAMASGWMAVRGKRRRRAVDRGFILSDHVDWPSLIKAVELSAAQSVWVTHGSTAVVSRYLCERGLDARPLQTRFGDEDGEGAGTAGDATTDR